MTEVVTHQTPPILQEPSDKEKKYDRQLRLWAANGQQALEDAHVLLLNSGSGTVGVETLKNLVLPGIGKITIADDALVNEADLGVNFFLDEESLGHARCQRCAELLQELNPDVKSQWVLTGENTPTETLFRSDIKYTLVICTTPVAEKTMAAVEAYSQRNKIPIISISSVGFYSYFSIKLPGNFPIVDTHPDSTAITDLRLLSPWSELSDFAAQMTVDIDNLDAHEHAHIPYLILLLHYLDEWKGAHEGKAPQKYADKVAFRNLVASGARTENAEGGEENYDEAVAAVLKTVTAPSLSSSVREVFEYAPDIEENQSSFWIITSAVKAFYVKHNALPLPGSVPDMKAQSEVYVRLQNIYKKKAREDVAEVFTAVLAHPNGGAIDIQEVETYCKNAAFIKLIRGNDLPPQDMKSLAHAELNAEFALAPTLIPIYIAMKASECVSAETEGEILNVISKAYGTDIANDERIVQAVKEVTRAKGGELHNISALTGGMVAQEIIKIITKQYVPIDNTCIFDGITSRTQIVRV